MKIKFSPCLSNMDTKIEFKDENTILIDGEEFEFNSNHVSWSDIIQQTEGKIIHAERRDELYLIVRRFYTTDFSWDTGDYCNFTEAIK